MKFFFYFIFLSFVSVNFITGQTSKYFFADGYYRFKIQGQKGKKVYVDNEEKFISVYALTGMGKDRHADTSAGTKQMFPQEKSAVMFKSCTFSKASFDIDFLAIPFKYRPAVNNLPNQFNTNLNGVVYLGYRNDVYHLQYNQSPLGKYLRKTRHYGFSIGAFSGLGGTVMNSSVTTNQAAVQYDGLVWENGAAFIAGVDNFSIGLAVGFDNLLDGNKKFWFYQNRPWLGLAFGLNLN